MYLSCRLWDLRVGVAAPSQAILPAHNSDVNAMRFSPIHAHLLLSGGEDGVVKVFDLRCTQMPLAEMDWHKKPITVGVYRCVSLSFLHDSSGFSSVFLLSAL